jgi:two-component system, OmpR family, sensor histidine kinase TctE
MIQARLRSLQMRLAVRLAIPYIIAMAAGVGILVYQAYDTAGSLNDRDLNLRAIDIARSASSNPDGKPQLDLPAKLAAAYQSSADMFAVRDARGQIIAASPPSFGTLVAAWPPATDDASYFRLKNFGSESEDYYGLSVGLESAAGPLSISVAQAAGANALVSALLREFLFDVAWVIPLLVLVTLVIGVLAIRSGLRPIRDVSEMAAAIGPNTTSVRLPDDNLPSEVTPLVSAVNRALDRLEQGFALQRKFTANAAHELRTPLAIITGALDVMEGNGELAKLKSDVSRMNRLVDQLLRVARLDSVTMDVSDEVDLNEIAANTIAAMAPWAVAQERAIIFDGLDRQVLVTGNGHAIEDALRNLIENAILHSPPQTEVIVRVSPERSINVVDAGSGISPGDRELIFERFWRGKGVASGGAGLGLSIVREIMNAHQGGVSVQANPNGGTIFTLQFLNAAEQHSSTQSI